MQARTDLSYRFGQYLCNNYLIQGETCPDVFYGTDPLAVFQEVFQDDELAVSRETNADDVDEWDSLMHVNLIIAALVLMLAGNFVSGLRVKGFLGALIAAIAIGLVGWLLAWLVGLLV